MPHTRSPRARAAAAGLAALALAALATRPAAAQTYTWNNFSNSGTLWSTASNWDPGAAVPGPDTVLLFPSSDQRQVAGGYTSTYDSAFDVNALAFPTAPPRARADHADRRLGRLDHPLQPLLGGPAGAAVDRADRDRVGH